eukprot:m51a1_g9014 hypothetical protein (894) ;mRNA; r:165137-168152
MDPSEVLWRPAVGPPREASPGAAKRASHDCCQSPDLSLCPDTALAPCWLQQEPREQQQALPETPVAEAVRLMTMFPADVRVAREGVWTLQSLCPSVSLPRLLGAGAVDALVASLRAHPIDQDLHCGVFRVLVRVAYEPCGRNALVCAGAIDVVLRSMRSQMASTLVLESATNLLVVLLSSEISDLVTASGAYAVLAESLAAHLDDEFFVVRLLRALSPFVRDSESHRLSAARAGVLGAAVSALRASPGSAAVSDAAGAVVAYILQSQGRRGDVAWAREDVVTLVVALKERLQSWFLWYALTAVAGSAAGHPLVWDCGGVDLALDVLWSASLSLGQQLHACHLLGTLVEAERNARVARGVCDAAMSAVLRFLDKAAERSDARLVAGGCLALCRVCARDEELAVCAAKVGAVDLVVRAVRLLRGPPQEAAAFALRALVVLSQPEESRELAARAGVCEVAVSLLRQPATSLWGLCASVLARVAAGGLEAVMAQVVQTGAVEAVSDAMASRPGDKALAVDGCRFLDEVSKVPALQGDAKLAPRVAQAIVEVVRAANAFEVLMPAGAALASFASCSRQSKSAILAALRAAVADTSRASDSDCRAAFVNMLWFIGPLVGAPPSLEFDSVPSALRSSWRISRRLSLRHASKINDGARGLLARMDFAHAVHSVTEDQQRTFYSTDFQAKPIDDCLGECDISGIVGAIAKCKEFLQRNRCVVPKGMTYDSAVAVLLYTFQFPESSVHKLLNEALARRSPGDLERWRHYLWHLVRGIRALPDYTGVALRKTCASHSHAKEYAAGARLLWTTVGSCVRPAMRGQSVVVGASFGVEFVVEVTEAKALGGMTLFPTDREEILLEPMSEFVVAQARTEGSNVCVVNLVQNITRFPCVPLDSAAGKHK